MSVAYVDIDRHACLAIRRAIERKLLPSGDVHNTDFRDLDPQRFVGRTMHWFAGIGGWAYALRMAGLPDNSGAWTASLPCQPFSSIGRRNGFSDERHLWPAFVRFISVCHPPALFGEQVAAPLGRSWFASVQADLERLGYAVASAILPAACVGAPHRRPRLYFAALANADMRAWLSRARGNWREGRNERRRGSDTLWRMDSCTPYRGGDGRFRPLAPGITPLADGVRPGRLAAVRLAGNAIVPQLGAAFVASVIRAAEDSLKGEA